MSIGLNKNKLMKIVLHFVFNLEKYNNISTCTKCGNFGEVMLHKLIKQISEACIELEMFI